MVEVSRSAVEDLRHQHMYHPVPVEEKCPALADVLNQVSSGLFGDGSVFEPYVKPPDFRQYADEPPSSLLNTIRQGDHYLLTDDFDSYIAALAMVDEAYLDRDEWIKKSIRTTAKVRFMMSSVNILLMVIKMGKFSSDRAILEYAESYWNLEQIPIV